MNLPTRQSQADRTSISVDKTMEFGRKADPGTSDAMITGSPFLLFAPCWWTRMQVEAILTNSPLKPAETTANNRSHAPAFRQRMNRSSMDHSAPGPQPTVHQNPNARVSIRRS